MARRILSEEERRLWHELQRSVTPLDARAPTPETPPALSKPVKIKRSAPALPAADNKAMEPLRLGQYAGIDRANADRLRKGKYAIDATLDLHGHGRERAYIAFCHFLAGQYAQGNRCLLVITGKGKADAPGVLKEQLPRWLEAPELRKLVLAFEVARPHHGGSGAFYILLKRKR